MVGRPHFLSHGFDEFGCRIGYGRNNHKAHGNVERSHIWATSHSVCQKLKLACTGKDFGFMFDLQTLDNLRIHLFPNVNWQRRHASQYLRISSSVKRSSQPEQLSKIILRYPIYVFLDVNLSTIFVFGQPFQSTPGQSISILQHIMKNSVDSDNTETSRCSDTYLKETSY